MTFVNIIGIVGVSMLLLAYFLNLFNLLSKNSHSYLWMNFAGAGLSCYASVLLNYMPFIVLEAIWSAVSAVAIVNKLR
ncbi:MAG TPA: hypothetical protein PKZ43_06765 [Bacteroidales bacterium]|nr:hypothetical protein [Bacteroidales bacterium]HQH19239.1 hypothetical protein [Bacteroidales bacterium]HQI46741.1 hypothetical protein [Bacteroidales bacterium]